MQVKFGAIVTNGSGKIGGQFISGDRSGSSLRTKNFKAKVSQVSTISQRGIVALMSRAWRELTEAQRQLWQSYASTQSLKNNSYGGAYLSGFQTFMQVNCSFYVDGDSIITAPSFNLDALPVQLMSFNFSNSLPSYNRGDSVGGGLFLGWIQEGDPLYDPLQPRAIICKDSNSPDTYVWQPAPLYSLGLSDISVGASISNSNLMFELLGSASEWNAYCRSYRGGGFSDWVSPSFNAACMVYYPTRLNGFFYTGVLGSNCENGSTAFQAVSLNNGSTLSIYKTNYVRAVPFRFPVITPRALLSLSLSDNLSANIKVKVSVTKPVSIGITNPRNTFTDLGIFTSSVDSKIDITAAYEAKFGSLSGLSGKIFIKAFVFDSVTKQRSNAFISSTTLS